jgi:hypothetical protein
VAALRRDVSLQNCESLCLLYQNIVCTNLLLAIHRSESAVMARLSALSSNILDLFVRSVVEITGVGVVDHCDGLQYVQSTIMCLIVSRIGMYDPRPSSLLIYMQSATPRRAP